MSIRLRDLEEVLRKKPVDRESDKRIRGSKIAIIDDEADALKSMINGVRREGFTNIEIITSVHSVYDLLNKDFDLIVLDLKGVASKQFKDDGVTVLSEIKNRAPEIPVLVLSGSTLSPNLSYELSRADRILTKPIRPGNLAAEIRETLMPQKDIYWATFKLLKELENLSEHSAFSPTFVDRVVLTFSRKRLESMIVNQSMSTSPICRIKKIVRKYGEPALFAFQISTAIIKLSSDAGVGHG
ncbi:MAG: response regulator [Wenzhouxiangella sp.]